MYHYPRRKIVTMPIKPVDLEKFIESTNNIHEAVVVASKRARQVNEDMRIEFNQRVEMVSVKTESETTEETEINPDQLRISVEFEKRPKPTDVALDELMQADLKWRYKEPEPVVAVAKDEEEED
jgi:DNA-directed RNA polymerase subunit K/omega